MTRQRRYAADRIVPEQLDQPGREMFGATDIWRTVGFTALQGVTIEIDGNLEDEPCPGVLLQESTEVEWFWATGVTDGGLNPNYEVFSQERKTRVVFGCIVGHEIVPVDESIGGRWFIRHNA